MELTTDITRAGTPTRPYPARPVHPVRPHALPRALFVGELLARRLPHVARESFRGEAKAPALAVRGIPVLIRSDAEGNEVEAFVRLSGTTIALIDVGYGQVTLEVAADTPQAATAGAAGLRRALETDSPPPQEVSIAFWMRGECGGDVRHRDIDAPRFEEIADNYSAPVRAALERLFGQRAPERGRLILWRGDPGTGKSHALRALARAWAPWCSAHFIMDPDELLGRGGSYMLDLLTSGSDDARWRLLILEDAGELIAADARAQTGQALSRLLNVADGIIGQGTRTLLLITTNEPVRRLHAAVRRPGRCLADIEFKPLSIEEANAWLAARGHSRRVDRPTPLAELFGHEDRPPLAANTDTKAPTFGFARALENHHD